MSAASLGWIARGGLVAALAANGAVHAGEVVPEPVRAADTADRREAAERGDRDGPGRGDDAPTPGWTEAEALYRQGRWADAQRALEALVAVRPLDPRGWLRLGNVHQRAGRTIAASAAYRNAALTVPTSAGQAEARDKARLNLALIALSDAGRHLDELEDSGAGADPALDAVRRSAADGLAALRRRADLGIARASDAGTADAATGGPAGAAPLRAPGGADAAAAPRDASAAGASVPRLGPGGARLPAAPSGPGNADARAAGPRSVATKTAAPAPADADGPYTVDRWIATPKRPTRRRGAARSGVAEPITESPLPPPPVVQTIRGGLGDRP